MSEGQSLTYFQRLQLIKIGKLPKEAIPKPKKKLRQVSLKKQAEEAEQKAKGSGKVATKLELDKWFFDISQKHGGGNGTSCMECGEWIPSNLMKHATAHLLPKKLFKSVATHELNYLILGAGCGCHYKTDRVDRFVQMKMWPEAARRIKIMIPLLPFEENQFLSNQLLTALDNT